MLKLVRNTVGDKKFIVDGDGNIVKWDYIKQLQELQASAGLHLGNKIRVSHINYHRKKWTLNLPHNYLVNRFADALQYCGTKKIPGFIGCEATVKFNRVFNRVFDVLQSRNLRTHGFKKPLSESNKVVVFKQLETDAEYNRLLKYSV